MGRLGNPEKFFSDTELLSINSAVNEAEKNTSAEVKVVVTRHCWGDLKEKAFKIFRKLDLHRTEQRNCVLVLLVVTNREFLIYGDEGIHQKVGQDFWGDVRDNMQQAFREDAFAEGMCEGLKLIGQKLCEYFPYQDGDVNEISDGIVFEK
ncbi:MAG: TPM domain-containing protein [Planctomycetota bacterium]|jgi:uncharacterized membrane protein